VWGSSAPGSDTQAADGVAPNSAAEGPGERRLSVATGLGQGVAGAAEALGWWDRSKTGN